MSRATKSALSSPAKSLLGWAVLPNPFATARGRAARARWLTRYDGLDRLTHADNTSNVTQRAYSVDKTGNDTGRQAALGQVQRFATSEALKMSPIMSFLNEALNDSPPPSSPLKREGWIGLSFDRNCHQRFFPEGIWAALIDVHQERHPEEQVGVQHVADAKRDLPPKLLPARVDAIQQYLLTDGFFLSDCYLFSLSRDWICRIDQDVVLIAGVKELVDAMVVKAGGRDHVLSQMYLDFDPDEADSVGLRRYVRDLLNGVRSEE